MISPPQFDPAVYDRWRKGRLGRITDELEKNLLLELIGPVAGLRVLDVGCGDGQLASLLARMGAVITAIDTDPQMLEAARRRLQRDAVEGTLIRADIEALPFASQRFDLVTAVTVLCFVGRPQQALREMARVLKPGGRLVVGELGRYSVWAVWRRLRAWLGHPTWRSAHFRSIAELVALARSAGLTVRATRAAIFYPPIGWVTPLLAPIDPWLGRRLASMGAFLALVALKPGLTPRTGQIRNRRN